MFVGPNGYFKIVIDDFDGTRINAWHFEDADGNKSVNLARLSTAAILTCWPIFPAARWAASPPAILSDVWKTSRPRQG